MIVIVQFAEHILFVVPMRQGDLLSGESVKEKPWQNLLQTKIPFNIVVS